MVAEALDRKSEDNITVMAIRLAAVSSRTSGVSSSTGAAVNNSGSSSRRGTGNRRESMEALCMQLHSEEFGSAEKGSQLVPAGFKLDEGGSPSE